MKTINLDKIKQTLEEQAQWRKDTRDQLKQACIRMVGTSEWHFQCTDLFPQLNYKFIAAGLRVHDGELYWLDANGLSRRSFRVDNQTYRVTTYHWEKMELKHIDYWMALYALIPNIAHTEHRDFTPQYVARDYSADIEAYAERYFKINLKGNKGEDAIAIRL